jgi:glycosyltransferase involved in cell wall biosynthesis
VRIVWVSHRSGLAGAELSLLEGARALAGRGVEVEAVLPGPGPLEERLRAAGAGVAVVPHARWVGPDRRPGGILRRLAVNARSLGPLTRLLRGLAPDVVVVNTLVAPLGAVAARRARLPVLWYVHEYGSAEHGIRFDLGRRGSLAAVRRLADAVAVNSEALRAHFAPLRPRVVRYAVDVPDRELTPIGDGPLRLVQLAALAPGKGQLDAVRALGLLVRRGVDARLRLVGPDLGHGAALREAAEEFEDRVEMAGFSDDPAGELLAADVALTCSRLEAFGRATVEAMKLGRPVVGAASGGTLELVRDGWNGLLYPPGDAEALADRIERLDRDRSLLRELGANAHAWARETFTSERYAADLLEALEAARS